MADDKQPRKQAVAPPRRPNAAEGLAAGLASIDWKAMQARLANITTALQGVQLPHGTGSKAAGQQQRDLEAAAIGGEQKPRRKRGTQGKTFLHGADRTVRYYKPTEAELDRLGELSKDEATAWARIAFCLGLLVNVFLGLLFATGMSAASKGAAGAIGVSAAVGALRFWRDAEKKRRDGKSALEKVKEDHDFANI